ncbi:hypothetical protein [Gemmobacter denitrificans]|uniref:Uncharacterized protein n=1 Tax=Gemmobacter denitrificans TaxID=3123040 RepID=A0ABU8BQR5_9RHOB
MMKSIEIFYDYKDIPGVDPSQDFPPGALDFRNAAMELIEAALEAESLGEWVGAEIGAGEVNFGFDVEDYDAAEVAVRRAVKGTPYEKIREIERRAFDPSDFED